MTEFLQRFLSVFLIGLISLALGMSIMLPSKDTFVHSDEVSASNDSSGQSFVWDGFMDNDFSSETPDADETQDPPQFYEIEMADDPNPKVFSQDSQYFNHYQRNWPVKFTPASWGEPPESVSAFA